MSLFSVFRIRNNVYGQKESVLIGTYEGRATTRKVVQDPAFAKTILRVVDHKKNKPSLLGWRIIRRIKRK